MENRLMDKHDVASFIGGISPRVAAGLMRTMPCVNVGNGEQRPKLRVYESDLVQWLENRKKVLQVPSCPPMSNRTSRKKKQDSYGEGLDENGHVLRRR